MKIGFLITARLKSKRLKLKLLLPLNGKPVIEHVIDRAKAVVDCEEVILCTSKTSQDLPLVKFAKKNGIYYFNGHSDDVLKRLHDASILYNLDYFIGITADNPLFSIYHANIIIDRLKKDCTLDFVFTSGLPIGINIYGMKVNALRTVCSVKNQIDTEIWGPLVNRPDIFNVLEIKAASGYSGKNYRMTIDEYDDYVFFKELYRNFENNGPLIRVLDAFHILDKNPNIAKLNAHVRQKNINAETLKEIDTYYKQHKKHILTIKNEIYNQS